MCFNFHPIKWKTIIIISQLSQYICIYYVFGIQGRDYYLIEEKRIDFHAKLLKLVIGDAFNIDWVCRRYGNNTLDWQVSFKRLSSRRPSSNWFCGHYPFCFHGNRCSPAMPLTVAYNILFIQIANTCVYNFSQYFIYIQLADMIYK